MAGKPTTTIILRQREYYWQELQQPSKSRDVVELGSDMHARLWCPGGSFCPSPTGDRAGQQQLAVTDAARGCQKSWWNWPLDERRWGSFLFHVIFFLMNGGKARIMSVDLKLHSDLVHLKIRSYSSTAGIWDLNWFYGTSLFCPLIYLLCPLHTLSKIWAHFTPPSISLVQFTPD